MPALVCLHSHTKHEKEDKLVQNIFGQRHHRFAEGAGQRWTENIAQSKDPMNKVELQTLSKSCAKCSRPAQGGKCRGGKQLRTRGPKNPLTHDQGSKSFQCEHQTLRTQP
eukprot:1150847-Pelagomonas_calceolata.AAC.3